MFLLFGAGHAPFLYISINFGPKCLVLLTLFWTSG